MSAPEFKTNASQHADENAAFKSAVESLVTQLSPNAQSPEYFFIKDSLQNYISVLRMKSAYNPEKKKEAEEVISKVENITKSLTDSTNKDSLRTSMQSDIHTISDRLEGIWNVMNKSTNSSPEYTTARDQYDDEKEKAVVDFLDKR